MFTNRQKLFLGSAVLLFVILVAGSYFGSRWLFGPDVESVTGYVLSDEPLPAQMNRPVLDSVSEQTSSVPEPEDELFSDSETESDSTQIDEELEAQLAALSDKENIMKLKAFVVLGSFFVLTILIVCVSVHA